MEATSEVLRAIRCGAELWLDPEVQEVLSSELISRVNATVDMSVAAWREANVDVDATFVYAYNQGLGVVTLLRDANPLEAGFLAQLPLTSHEIATLVGCRMSYLFMEGRL